MFNIHILEKLSTVQKTSCPYCHVNFYRKSFIFPKEVFLPKSSSMKLPCHSIFGHSILALSRHWLLLRIQNSRANLTPKLPEENSCSFIALLLTRNKRNSIYGVRDNSEALGPTHLSHHEKGARYGKQYIDHRYPRKMIGL